MSAAAGVSPQWEQWEGDVVDGEFRLEKFLGASDSGAVFRIRIPSGDAAIKLVPAADVQAANLVERWNQAGALDHPHIIKISKTGTWKNAGVTMAYLIMDYAEEDLATVLSERPLTAGETLEMLQPVSLALAFLHGHGFVHGRLKPSNILAVNDTLKISSDSVSKGDAAEDIRALAATMVYTLTQERVTFSPVSFSKDNVDTRLIDTLPPPFQEIARNCTGQGGRAQWSAPQLASWLHAAGSAAARIAPTPARVSPTVTRQPRLSYYAIGLIMFAVVVITVGALLRNRTGEPGSVVPQSSPKPAETVAMAEPPATLKKKTAVPQVKPPLLARELPPRAVVVDSQEQVLRQVLPDIPAKSRRSIRGKATVVIRVVVDPSGNVTDAALQPGGSRYFRTLSLKAARNWHFSPENGAAPREWFLRFEIDRSETKVFLEKTVLP